MAFRFSLETILRLRRSQEEQERLRLQALFAQRTGLESLLRLTEQTRAGLKAHELPSAGGSPIRAAELHFVTARRRSCELEAERLRQTLAEVEQQIAAQTVAFVARSRARKVLEKLREKKLDSYEVYERRRAQAHLEELALLIRGSRRSAVEASEKE